MAFTAHEFDILKFIRQVTRFVKIALFTINRIRFQDRFHWRRYFHTHFTFKYSLGIYYNRKLEEEPQWNQRVINCLCACVFADELHSGNWINLPFNMCTRTEIGLAFDGAHVYIPESLWMAFCTSRRLVVRRPFSVTSDIPPRGESKFITYWHRNRKSKQINTMSIKLQSN